MFFLSKSRLITVDFFPNRIKVSKVNRPLSGYKPIKESSCVVFDHLNLACAWNQVENETDRVKNGKRCAFDGLLIFLMSHGYWLYIQFSNPRKNILLRKLMDGQKRLTCFIQLQRWKKKLFLLLPRIARWWTAVSIYSQWQISLAAIKPALLLHAQQQSLDRLGSEYRKHSSWCNSYIPRHLKCLSTREIA